MQAVGTKTHICTDRKAVSACASCYASTVVEQKDSRSLSTLGDIRRVVRGDTASHTYTSRHTYSVTRNRVMHFFLSLQEMETERYEQPVRICVASGRFRQVAKGLFLNVPDEEFFFALKRLLSSDDGVNGVRV